MNIPGIGEVTKDDRYGEYHSSPISLSILNGQEFQMVIEGYEGDPAKEDFHLAISNFISSSHSVLLEAENNIFEYFKDINSHWESSDGSFYCRTDRDPRQHWV